jgi:hypothetical protein
LKNAIALAVLLCCCVSVLCASKVRAEAPLYVGVIEDIEDSEPGALPPGMKGVHVRVAFRKQGAEWVPMKSDFDNQAALAQADRYFPGKVDWTVVFDGQRIGTITSRNLLPPGDYGDVGIQTITSDPSKIPRFETGAEQFYVADARARTRLLLVVSEPNFKDPNGWRRTKLSAAEAAIAVKEFRRIIPTMRQCKAPEDESARMAPYADREVLLVAAYRSRTGEVLFGERLNPARNTCEFFDDENFHDYWFVIDEHHEVRRLGSQLTAIDAADLDDSGRSEWVFKTFRGEDEDGYELFYDDFAKKAWFQWAYH